MGLPGNPHLSYLQFGREATWGAQVPATHRIPFVSSTIRFRPGVIRSRMMSGVLGVKDAYAGKHVVEGQMVFEFDYEAFLLFLDGIFGTATFGSNGGTTTGPVGSIFTHSFIIRQLLNSYTFELIEGDIPTGKCTVYTGLKIVGLELAGEGLEGDSAIVRMTLDVVAKGSMVTNQTPTAALSSPTLFPVLNGHATTKDDGTGDVAADTVIRRWSVRLTSVHTGLRDDLGAAIQPLRNGHPTVRWSFTKEFQTRTAKDAASAFTSGSPQLIFSGAASRKVTIQSGLTKIVEPVGPDISGEEAMVEDFEWEALYDATDASLLKIIVENTKATITT